MALKTAKSTSLGGRIVLTTLVFCLLFTLIVAAVRTWSAWQNNVSRMSDEIALIAQVYQQTVSKSIWEMDRDSLQTHLNSMANAASVGQVVVTLQSANHAPEIFRRVGPVAIRFNPLTIQLHSAKEANIERSSPRSGEKSISSTHADSRNLAKLRSRFNLLFSR